MSDQLNFKAGDKRAVRLAALLHDAGHGPFSHLFEEVMAYVNGSGFSHENVTKLIIENDRNLGRALGGLRGEVLGVLTGDSIMSEIISSSIDADKIDYLRRDSYHTGVAYGVFDLERVVRSVCKITRPERSYIGITEKGIDSLEGYRLARFSMHKQVYEHHARLVADDMFVRAVTMAIDEGAIPKEDLDISNPERFLKAYYSLDDSSIETLVMTKGGRESSQFIRDIRDRKLLKRAFVLPLTKDGVPDALERERLTMMSKNTANEIEKQIATEADTDPNRVILHMQSIKIKLYERFEQSLGKKEKPILIFNRDGSVTSLDEVSSISASLEPIRKILVFAPASKRAKVREISEGIFHAKSKY